MKVLRKVKIIIKKILFVILNAIWNMHSVIYLIGMKAFERCPPPQSDSCMDSSKRIYLTFDDGPSPYTRKLLSILKQYNIKATFFVTGNGDTDIITDIARDGHTIGNHTASHDYKSIYASEKMFLEDLQRMDAIINEKTGIHSLIMRFPGGSSNTVSRFNPEIMTRLVEIVQKMGYHYFDWNVDSDDAGRTKTSYGVFRNVTKGIIGTNDAVVLQHDAKRYSVLAVQRIVVWGLKNGYVFLALDENSPSVHHRINN